MSAKFLKPAAGILGACFAATVLAWDQDPAGDGLIDDVISPWCRIGSPESWEGKPCVVPQRIGSADQTAVLRGHEQWRP